MCVCTPTRKYCLFIRQHPSDFLTRIVALRDLPWLLRCTGIAAKFINNRQTRARTYLYIYEGRHCLRNGFREEKLRLRVALRLNNTLRITNFLRQNVSASVKVACVMNTNHALTCIKREPSVSSSIARTLY